ncbi:MAG: hypothetical protein ABII22_05730 [Candidatus Micrarchaeota archaeon]
MQYSDLLDKGKFQDLKKFCLTMWKQEKDKKALSYYGISLLLNKEYEKARGYFGKRYLKSKDRMLIIYHAMANIGLGEIEKAQKDLLYELKQEKEIPVLLQIFRIFLVINNFPNAKKAIKKAFSIDFDKTVSSLEMYYKEFGETKLAEETVQLLKDLNLKS